MKNRIENSQELRNELIKLRKRVSGLEEILKGLPGAMETGEPVFDSEKERIDDVSGERIKDELKKSEEKFRNVIQSSPMGVHMYRLDPDGRLIFTGANRAADEILGIDNSQYIGKTIEEAFPSAVDTEIPERYRKAAAEGIPWQTSQINYKDEKVAGAYEVYAFQTSRGRMAVMFLDITERIQADELRIQLEQQLRQSQKMEAVGQLAGGIAHDFNNLLTTISGYSELILDQIQSNDQLVADVGEIRKAVDRASALTGQLLAFSRKQIISPKIVDINSCVENAYQMIRRLISEDIELRLELADQPYLVEVDPAQIDQIIVNLAVNSRDAMIKGGKLEISAGSTVLDEADCREVSGVEPGPFVWISVTDDGHGMDQETVDHIFEPFFTTKEYGKGTGLGLPIVYGVVKQYRGIIKVHSEPGSGTTVRIFLPQAEGSVNDPVTESRMAPSTGDETILLVEDEDAVRALTRKILASRGYTVLAAQSTADAVKICGEHDGPIHLLLTDVIMPHCNGQELYHQVRDILPSIKVLYMSGYAADVIAKHGVLEKDVAFISKPFNVDTLITKIRESLDHDVPA